MILRFRYTSWPFCCCHVCRWDDWPFFWMGGGVILVETGHCNVQSKQLKRSSTLERIKCCGEKKGKNQSWRRQSWRWQNNKMFTGPVLRIILELLFVFWLLREKYENCLSLEFLLSKSLNTSFDYHLLLAINDVTILTFKQNSTSSIGSDAFC